MNAILSNDLLPTKVDPSDDAAILALFESLALSAGRAIMAVFDAGSIHEMKVDVCPASGHSTGLQQRPASMWHKTAKTLHSDGISAALQDVQGFEFLWQAGPAWRQPFSGAVPIIGGQEPLALRRVSSSS